MARTPDIIWAVGDSLPDLPAQLLDGNDNPIDLTNATVTFVVKDWWYLNTPLWEEVCDIVDDANGQVSIIMEVDDPIVTGALSRGEYAARFEIEYPGNLKLSVPNNDWFTLWIV